MSAKPPLFSLPPGEILAALRKQEAEWRRMRGLGQQPYPTGLTNPEAAPGHAPQHSPTHGEETMFGALKKAFGAGAREVKANYSENKDYLEAVCAASALVAFADGELEDGERSKVVSVLANHPVLGKMYDRNAIEATADTMFKRAKDASGRQSLARELDDIKGRADGAQMSEDVYLIAVDVSAADGEVEPEEKVALEKIAKRLGVDPAKFEF